jgi:site-specific recombinase XerD
MKQQTRNQQPKHQMKYQGGVRRRRIITARDAEAFERTLRLQERSAATAEKYGRYARFFTEFIRECAGGALTREAALEFKRYITERHSAAGANGMLAAVNSYMRFLGREELRVSPLKLQHRVFADEQREMRREDFEKLLRAAEKLGRTRTELILRAMHATGIRVSELVCVTRAAVDTGVAEITMKGKTREVFLPEKLRRRLLDYAKAQNISEGALFITRAGKPIDRHAVWREMKALCAEANVSPERVFPHNIRRLFARIFYAAIPSLAELADVLGHSDVNTTRIYTASTAKSLRSRMAALPLLL